MIDDVKDTEDKEEGNNPHIRRTYTLKQVCELVNSGCVMFSLQLMGPPRIQNVYFFSMSGLLCEICGAAYGMQLQLHHHNLCDSSLTSSRKLSQQS